MDSSFKLISNCSHFDHHYIFCLFILSPGGMSKSARFAEVVTAFCGCPVMLVDSSFMQLVLNRTTILQLSSPSSPALNERFVGTS